MVELTQVLYAEGRLRGDRRIIMVVCGEEEGLYGSSEGERRFIWVVCGEIEGF